MHKMTDLPGSFRASRREFLRIAMVLPLWWKSRGLELRLGLIIDPQSRDAERGAALSARECIRSGELLGATLSDAAPWDAVVAACSTVRLRQIVSAIPGAVIVNATVPADQAQIIEPRVFHILRTEAERARLWDPAAEKYGAAQLNARYRHHYNDPMMPDAWSGWFAVKVLWESMLRARSSRADDLVAFLESSRAQFDGHRGRPLRFDPLAHILT